MGMRPKVRDTGSKGEKILGDIIEYELGWLYRKQPLETDYGIDSHIEIVEQGEATGQIIGVQIKTGQSWFKEEKDDGFVFRGDMEHYNYWTNHTLPVILVLCNYEEKECYWIQIKEENIQIISDNSWKVIVPKKQKIDRNSKFDLMKVADNKSEYEKKLDMLIVAKPLLKELKNGNKVILESEEWINKLSGKGSLTIKVIDSYSEQEKVAIDWPYIYIPGWCYQDAFRNLFPWANISVDEEFYEDYDEDEFKLAYAYYDSEEDE
ncbi:hypothetical protein JCM1393_20130 [Clostridium carnis]